MLTTCQNAVYQAVKGPITEEFLFRGCIIAVLFSANYRREVLVLISALHFSIGRNWLDGAVFLLMSLAHLHHFADNLHGSSNKVGPALAITGLCSSPPPPGAKARSKPKRLSNFIHLYFWINIWCPHDKNWTSPGLDSCTCILQLVWISRSPFTREVLENVAM